MTGPIYRMILVLLGITVADLWAGGWQLISPLQTPRGGAAAIAYSDKIYVFGGKSIDNKVLNTVELYPPENGFWDTTAVPSFTIPRYNASVVIYDNRIYLIGGRDEEKVFNDVEVYDPEQNMWSSVQKLRNDRESLAAAVFNDRIYAIGGQRADYNLVEEIEWYNYGENDWLEAIFNLPYPRAAHFSAVVQDTFFMFGGYYYGLTKTSYKCFPGQDGYKWFPGPQMSYGRAYGATAQTDSLIYLLGGETSGGKTAVTEIYNVYMDSFSIGPSLTSARSGMAGAALGDTVFVIGGFDGIYDQPMDLVEIYIETPTILINPDNGTPVSTGLIKGYPNPFNGLITFEISVTKSAEYRLNIFNIRGQHIKSLHSGRLNQGTHYFQWNGTGISNQYTASGIYVLALNSGDYFEKYKIVYVK